MGAENPDRIHYRSSHWCSSSIAKGSLAFSLRAVMLGMVCHRRVLVVMAGLVEAVVD